MDLILVVGGAAFALIAARSIMSARARKRRREVLMAKYGDAYIVDGILAKRIWVGMTREQLADSRGKPADIGDKRLKTKTVETWKYYPAGQNRFRSRMTVENGVVIGWDEK
jgi:hypothetical protein